MKVRNGNVLGLLLAVSMAGCSTPGLMESAHELGQMADTHALPRELDAGARKKVYYVVGEVASPGVFPLEGHETVLDGILTAGGVCHTADRCKIIVSRPTRPDCDRTVLPVSYDDIVQLGDTSTNYELQPGDRIYVPGRRLCGHFSGLLSIHCCLPDCFPAFWRFPCLFGGHTDCCESQAEAEATPAPAPSEALPLPKKSVWKEASPTKASSARAETSNPAGTPAKSPNIVKVKSVRPQQVENIPVRPTEVPAPRRNTVVARPESSKSIKGARPAPEVETAPTESTEQIPVHPESEKTSVTAPASPRRVKQPLPAPSTPPAAATTVDVPEAPATNNKPARSPDHTTGGPMLTPDSGS